jgi:hypothetical protein
LRLPGQSGSSLRTTPSVWRPECSRRGVGKGTRITNFSEKTFPAFWKNSQRGGSRMRTADPDTLRDNRGPEGWAGRRLHPRPRFFTSDPRDVRACPLPPSYHHCHIARLQGDERTKAEKADARKRDAREGLPE